MELTKDQQIAYETVKDLQDAFPNGGGIAVINGYAGVGKTSLLRFLSEDSNASLRVVTPTGKAAQRVAQVVGKVTAGTIHSWLYEPTENPETGQTEWTLKPSVDEPANKTLFVDEASMVSYRTYCDIVETCRKSGLNVVFIGDGFQLPPVETNDAHKGFSVMSPDTPAHVRVHMTEVVRQAKESPIIRASMELRDPRSDLENFAGLPTISPDELVPFAAKTFKSGGATVCHTNALRHSLNRDIRAHIGKNPHKIEHGEPLMVIANSGELDVYNGELVDVISTPAPYGDQSLSIVDRYANKALESWIQQCTVKTASDKKTVLFADREVFGDTNGVSTRAISKAVSKFARHQAIKEKRDEGVRISYTELNTITGIPFLSANLGYVLTAHKAQGSEWGNVLVVLEKSVRMHSSEGRRWLYTAVTRGKNLVTICYQ